MIKIRESGGEAGRLASDEKLARNARNTENGTSKLHEDIRAIREEFPDGTKIKLDVREYLGQVLVIKGVDNYGLMRLQKSDGTEFDSIYSITSPVITKVE